MIAYLEGVIQYKQPEQKHLIVLVAGIGYKVAVPLSLLDQVQVDSPIRLFTHQHVREDAIALYGFRSFTELNVFERLITVSGVGPKVALALLSHYAVAQLTAAIVHGDASALTLVSGVGKKTAERIILELKNVLVTDLTEADHVDLAYTTAAKLDAAVALESLGYSQREAQQMLAMVDTNLNPAEQVKAALQQRS